jgi:hypothetical protein
MDDEIKLIDAKFGVAGFGVLVKVWQIIYDHGYYALWTERELLLYKSRINADINFINDVINECLQWGIFSKEMYNKFSVLTSKGIQKRFFEATCRRQTVAITSEVLLMPIPDNYKPSLIALPIVYVNRNIKNADINPKNTDSGTQSKVKESKVKESKVKNIPAPDKINFADDVFLTQKEHDTLVAKYGEEAVKWMITKLDNSKGAKGYKYKSDYRAILTWVVDAYMEKKGKQPDKPGEQQQPWERLPWPDGLKPYPPEKAADLISKEAREKYDKFFKAHGIDMEEERVKAWKNGR